MSGDFKDARLLLLTTTGARSGREHTVPLGYLPDSAERVIVIGSASASARDPDWFHNVRANPRVTIENGPFTGAAEAEILQGSERDRIVARAAEVEPGRADYGQTGGRSLPVVALTMVDGGPPPGPLGEALKDIHGTFRRELALIRREVAKTGPRIGAQLRINCLTVCEGLHYHHQGEDGGIFPAVEGQHPELASTMERLRAEHETIKVLLDQLQKVLADDEVEPTRLRADVDRLTGELEAHLDYEEEQLVPILNALTPSA